ncbi:MAG TPA: MerR family transcriptional regulator [Chloroflexia bacterium]|nr:MerR family transcriptional regulator [Chloroflexia bacterium]
MERQFYPIGRFARKAAVSIRTLRYYDQEGLFSPTQVTEAGYRLYTDEDLGTLQQILALKFLGFTLDEIRVLLRSGPRHLPAVLDQQKAMLQAKRAQLDGIIAAIEETEKLLQAGPGDWESLVRVIQAMQQEQKPEWVRKYLTPEQQQQMAALAAQSYSAAARAQLADRVWTEADQQQASAQWAAIGAEIGRLTALGADPTGPEAQALAQQYRALIGAFTGGDPDIAAGLRHWWQNVAALPETARPVHPPYGPAGQAFLEQALALSAPPP